MSEIGTIIIYMIMAGALVGAAASVLCPESGLGKEFVNGIHSIGPVFLAQAGIMAAIPIISYAITNTIGPLFQSMGSDVSIAALSVIAVDMGGYQLADVIASNRDQWITAMLIGYTSGASIVYLIPVGLIMLNRQDHKYLALGAMAGLVSIPFGVLISLMFITLNNIPVRDIISTSSPANHYLTI
ncbi:TPA: ethanolamine utilization protein EutH, partial [Escherichia coli]